MKSRIYISVVVIGIFVATGFFVRDLLRAHTSQENQTIQTNVASTRIGRTFGQAQLGGHFELTGHNGVKRTEADFKGKFMIVYFGYSFCPDICPAALYNITQALNQMKDKEVTEFQVLFITIDPERDTVKNLKIYMENYHENFIALTGTKGQVNQAMNLYKVYAKKAMPDGTSTEYLMDHSSIVYVMDRQGRFITSFNHQTPPKRIINILRRRCLE